MADANIEKISDFLSSEGEAIPSACDDEVAGIALAQKLYPGKPYCSVRQWVLVDLDISDDKKALVAEQGFRPILLYAHAVVNDSACRFSPGDWVRSTLLVDLKSNCLFETRNSVYILLGAGSRKTVEPAVVTGIF
ncbi:hypothetical protein SAMN05216370_3130 [Pseudomonas peli]|jgi:hypothetical protein|uniref:DUF6957 domain-containing protein n=1 Tax=Pseudomonas peli TaxID=592361 RepID=A0AB37ZA72_9PSED|nr:hypothetical protein [Pseudomonas peli]MBU0811888.1 hypothetical protein [Gammaproteobacteria bacterium]MDX1356937.1 hypothetical protein [Halomonas venusta]NMZ67800.1 hypothetical protein [Pseudomonas peli]SCW74824.1 hypothetical protein SAMN05216370_3130 [Pseudomonas peli]